MYPERSVFMRAHLRASLVLAAIALSACADNTFTGDIGSGSITGPGASLTLQLSRDSVSVDTGTVVVLSATLSNGADPSSVGTITWSTSDNRVATVSGAGVVKGIAAGSARITASVGTTSAAAKVVVTAPTGSTPVTPPPTTPATGAEPALPQATVPVEMPAVTGQSIRVNAGGDLQAALNAAQ